MLPDFILNPFIKIFKLQAIRFLIVGAINSIFGFVIFSGIMLAGLAPWQALLGGNLAGIAFNFFTLGGVVFRELSSSRLPRFISAYLFILIINTWLIEIISARYGIGKILTQAYLTPPLAIISYLIMKHLVFKK